MKWIVSIIFCFLGLGSLFTDPNNRIEVQVSVATKVALGKKLFFDPILSLDQTISCASCHKPEFAYADNSQFSFGVNDSLGIRNTPSIMNMLNRPYFFYDGRAATLEEQVITPIENPNEMNLFYDIAVKRVQENSDYDSLFRMIYGNKPDSINIAKALAKFQRSLEGNGSAPHDLWMNGIDSSALTDSQIRGREIFLSEEFKCFDCHFGPDFTGDEFRNIGLYDELTLFDKGRYEVSKDPSDLGKFKVPGLRNIGLTAPYMHNGMLETLEEVVDYYSNPYAFVKAPINMDSLMVEPLNFSQEQKDDLVNFLHSLTDNKIPHRY